MSSPSYLDPNKLRQIFFLLIIVLLGILLFNQLQAFLPATLGAFTLYVLMNKWMRRLTERGWKPALAASLLMFLSFIVIVIPIGLLIKMIISRISISEQQLQQAINAVQHFIKDIEHRTRFELLSDKYLEQLGGLVAKELPTILGATFNTITTIVVMYFILFFMLTQGKSMEGAFLELLPMSKKYQGELQKEVTALVYSNAIGIPLIAFLQGVVALIGYLIIGVQEPWLWFAVTCIAAMLPIVGASVAYVPLAIMFFVAGDGWRGIAMLLFGFLVIGSADNIFRFWLQKKIGDVHPLITVFGVILGLQLFGFIGLVFGPLLISVFILLVSIYRLEFGAQPFHADDPFKTPGIQEPAEKTEE